MMDALSLLRARAGNPRTLSRKLIVSLCVITLISSPIQGIASGAAVSCPQVTIYFENRVYHTGIIDLGDVPVDCLVYAQFSMARTTSGEAGPLGDPRSMMTASYEGDSSIEPTLTGISFDEYDPSSRALGPSTPANLNVRFQPTTIGEFIGVITIHFGSGSPRDVAVTVTGRGVPRDTTDLSPPVVLSQGEIPGDEGGGDGQDDEDGADEPIPNLPEPKKSGFEVFGEFLAGIGDGIGEEFWNIVNAVSDPFGTVDAIRKTVGDAIASGDILQILSLFDPTEGARLGVPAAIDAWNAEKFREAGMQLVKIIVSAIETGALIVGGGLLIKAGRGIVKAGAKNSIKTGVTKVKNGVQQLREGVTRSSKQVKDRVMTLDQKRTIQKTGNSAMVPEKSHDMRRWLKDKGAIEWTSAYDTRKGEFKHFPEPGEMYTYTTESGKKVDVRMMEGNPHSPDPTKRTRAVFTEHQGGQPGGKWVNPDGTQAKRGDAHIYLDK